MSLLVTSLALSLAGLAVGPALVALGRGRALPSAAIEGFTLGVVPTILALRLVPHVVEGVGAVTGILLVLAGYALLWGADRKLHRGGARVGAQVVVPALALHALSDGAGLAVATASSGAGFRPGLVAALLLHRLPEGLFMTSALLPIFGWRGTALRLGAVGAATVIGAVGGRLLLTHVPDAFLDAVVALAAGAILRLVLHSHSPPPTTVRGRALSGAAFLFGAALVVWVPDPDSVLLRSQAAELNAADALTALFVECAPAVLVGVALLALLRRVAPTTGHGLFASTLRGLREPEGLHGMLREGLPVAALGAWAAARVALDPVSLTLGARLMGWRFVGAAVAAVAVGAAGLALALRRERRAPANTGVTHDHGHHHHHHHDEEESDGPVATVAAHDRLDTSALRLSLGFVAAAVLEAALDPSLLAPLCGRWDVLLGALAGVAFGAGSLAALPVAAVLVHKGLSVGAALAWVLVAGGSGPVTIGAFREHAGPRAARTLPVVLVLVGAAAGWVANALIPRGSVPEIHGLARHAHTPVEWVSAALLVLLVAASVVRQGPRRWFGTLGSA